MKIQIAQINSYCGQVKKNLDRHMEILQSASPDSYTVFPYKSLCGFPLGSKVEYPSLLSDFENIVSELDRARKNYVVSLPYLAQGKISFFHHCSSDQTETPNRNNKGMCLLQQEPQCIVAGLLGELSSIDIPAGTHIHVALLFDDKPFHVEKSIQCDEVVHSFITTFRPDCTLLIRRTGGEGGLIFEGNSKVYNRKGELCAEAPRFEESTLVIDTEHLSPITPQKPDRIAMMHEAIVSGIRDYFKKNGIQKAFLGLSGGIDSALVVVLAVEALGKENVKGILMPSAVSSDHSITDAEKSAQNLGIRYHIIPIEPIFQRISLSLHPLFQGLPTDLTEENIQARVRGIILMAISNKFGGALLNTSNKSESAVGYGTLYGDMCGGLAPIADVYKTDVWAMARYINRRQEIIPWNSINKVPSAELRPGQKDSDSLPDYDLLDKVLYDYLENCLSEQELLAKGYDAELIHRIVHLIRINEWKRRQAPPPIKTARRTFGREILFPIA